MRLDVALTDRQLVSSRTRAKRLIESGNVAVDGEVQRKASFPVSPEQSIALLGEDHPFVGRGGVKLSRALEAGQLDVRGRICLDVGASTGGFTDCLLQRGAAKVYAVDVGHDQLDPTLRQNPHVVSLEGCDIRTLKREAIPDPITFLCADVSFISLRLILPAAAAFLDRGADAVVLIKPQFEAGREAVGKGGIVSSKRVHVRVLGDMAKLFSDTGFALRTLLPSPIRGGSGNREYLAVLRKEDAACMIEPNFDRIVEEAFDL